MPASGSVIGENFGQIVFTGDIVALVDIDMIGPQLLQAGFDILQDRRRAAAERFAGDDDLVPIAGKDAPEFAFTVGINARRVKKIDPRVDGFFQNAGRTLSKARRWMGIPPMPMRRTFNPVAPNCTSLAVPAFLVGSLIQIQSPFA